MGSASGVKAGEAYFELSLLDRTSKSLDAAKARFQRFAAGMAAAGAGLTAVGGGLLAGLGGAVGEFTRLGGALQDASDRTGVEASSLSALQFAAEETGVGMESLEGGLKGMAKFTFAIKAGSKGASDVLNQLGINAEQFLASSVTGRLGMIADGLQRIPDPGMRAALAMKALGKGGVDLGPMMAGGAAGLNALIGKAEELGLVLSSEDIAKADELGDSWAALKKQVATAFFSIGASVAEPLITAVQWLQRVLAISIHFIRQHRQLIAMLAIAFAIAGGAALGLGSSLLALAAAGFAAAGVMQFFQTIVMLTNGALFLLSNASVIATGALSILATVLGAILSPIGLIVIAVLGLGAVLVAGIALWFAYSDSGQKAFANLTANLLAFAETFKTTLVGMFDALLAGDLTLAWRIGLAGMNVLWMQFVETWKRGWSAFVGFFSDSWVIIKSYVASSINWIVTSFIGGFTRLHDWIVEWANRVAKALGLSVQFDGLDAIKDFNDRVQAGGKEIEDTIQRTKEAELEANREAREQRLKGARDATDQARADLEALRQEAADAREKMMEAFRVRAPKIDGGALGGLAGVGPAAGGGILGAFSGAAAALLGRSTPESHKIEENTKRTAEAVEELADREGLAWE